MSIIEKEQQVEVQAVPQKTEADKIGELLERAADIIEQRGWCRRWLMNSKGEVCLEGAVSLAYGFDLKSGDRFMQIIDRGGLDLWKLLVSLRDDGLSWNYNDAFGRTKQEVVRTLREKAATYSDG